MSHGIPPQVVNSAERCSQFSRQRGMRIDRVIYNYRTVRCSGELWHVLTSIQDAGADYSGRTNHLAQHLILSPPEASDLSKRGSTPAGVMLGTVCTWSAYDGFCGWLEENPHAVSSEPDGSWRHWDLYTGSGYSRRNLCSDAALRGAVLIYGRGLEQQTDYEAQQVLSLFAESQAGCPDKGWGITFTTNPEPNDELSDFRWIGVAEDSSMLGKVEALTGRVRVTFETPPPAALRPNLVSRDSSLINQTSAHDAASMGTNAGTNASDTAPQPTRIPPQRRTLPHAKKSFLGQHRFALVIGAVVLVGVVVVGLLLRSAFSEAPIKFLGSLMVEYDGNPKSVALSDGRPVFYLQSSNIPIEWSSQPPVDAGRYEIGVETSHWLGLQKRVSPTSKALIINQKRPLISFPENLEFTTSEGSTNAWPIEPIINPPEAEAGKVVEYRNLSAQSSDWDDEPQTRSGKYEVKVSTQATRNFAAATEITNFAIVIDNKEPPVTNAVDGGARAVAIAHAESPSIASYYLALGSEALSVAQKQQNLDWRDKPDKVAVCQWENDSKKYDDLNKAGNLEDLSKDFKITGGGLPEELRDTSSIKTDVMIYRATYQDFPREVYLIGLRKNGDNSVAIANFLPRTAWLCVNHESKLLELTSRNEFFKHTKLLPAGAKWALVYEDSPYSEGQGALRIESETAAFDVAVLINKAEEARKTAADQLRMIEEQANMPPQGDNYFDQNKPKITGPLEKLSDPSPLANRIVEGIGNLQKPDLDKTKPGLESQLATALLIGALKITYGDQDLQARMQLSTEDQNKIDGQLKAARSDQGGRNYSMIKDENLLPLDELESWLAERQSDPRDVAVKWLDWRLKNLQPPPEGMSKLNDPGKIALVALRQGLKDCSDTTSGTARKADPTVKESLRKQIQAAEEKVRVLSSWGTSGASGHAKLQLRFGSSEPVTVTLWPNVLLAPPSE